MTVEAADAVGVTKQEQAVQLRLAGLSRSQIADALGLGSGGEPLSRWLHDVPPPAWTRRPRAKDDLRALAVAMRRDGRSYREIQEVVGAAKSTLSLWLRDVPLTDEQRLALAQRGPEATRKNAQAARANATRRRDRIQREARDQISRLSESELFVAGIVAYWAEGTKNKPWRFGQAVIFMNSDAGLVRLFLRWLALMGVGADRLQFRLMIHESADVTGALDFWCGVVDAPRAAFGNTTLKRHNPRTSRRNIGDDYHGCLAIYVRRSADLNLRIAGWCEGLVQAFGGTLDPDRESSNGRTSVFGTDNGGSTPPSRAEAPPLTGGREVEQTYASSSAVGRGDGCG